MGLLSDRWRRRITQLDAFPKVETQITNTTNSGGFLTVAVSVLMCILAFAEFHEYWKIQHEYEYLVDPTVASSTSLNGAATQLGKLQINLDITLNMKCDLFTINVVDAAGDSMHVKDKVQIKHVTAFDAEAAKVAEQRAKVWEEREGGYTLLNSFVNLAESFRKKNSTHEKHKKVMENQQKMFGNARDMIEAAFDETPKNVEKRADGTSGELMVMEVDSASATSCRIKGAIPVNKVAGNLHITAHGHGYGGGHVDHSAMNFSHIVHKLSFGRHYPNKFDPLDGAIEIATDNFDMFQYFIAVVPTIYQDKFSGRTLLTNQYAVKTHQKTVNNEKGNHGLPGIFIKYDIESMSVRISATGKPFLPTLLRICSIVGGIFVTMGIVHSVGMLMYYKFIGGGVPSTVGGARYTQLPKDDDLRNVSSTGGASPLPPNGLPPLQIMPTFLHSHPATAGLASASPMSAGLSGSLSAYPSTISPSLRPINSAFPAPNSPLLSATSATSPSPPSKHRDSISSSSSHTSHYSYTTAQSLGNASPY